jgi:hypothetical protein
VGAVEQGQQHDNVLVFWASPNGRDEWKPVPREDIPEWLRDQDLIDRMVAGEMVKNADREERWWKVTVIDRKPVPVLAKNLKRFGYIHTPGCGMVAFYLSRRPPAGSNLEATDMIKVDGSLHDPRERPKCGVCGLTMGWDLKSVHIVEMS